MNDLPPTTGPLPATLSVTQAAKLIGISRTLAFDLAREGRLPTIRVGCKRRVLTAELCEQFALRPASIGDPNFERSEGASLASA